MSGKSLLAGCALGAAAGALTGPGAGLGCLAGLAMTALTGCDNSSNTPPQPPPCNYGDSKSICTLTFKPAGPTQVRIDTDEFVATEINLTPVKLYPNLCSIWRPDIALYTPPSAPYPKTPDELLVAYKSGINQVKKVPQSEEPFVICSNYTLYDDTHQFDRGDPWGVLTQGGDFHGVEPSQILDGLKLKFPTAQSVSPALQFIKVDPSSLAIRFPFSINDQFGDTGPISFGIAKTSLSKIGTPQSKETPDVSLLTRVDIDRAIEKGNIFWMTYVSPSQLLYLYRSEEVLDSKGKPAIFNRATPVYTFLEGFQPTEAVKLPEKLNYDPKTEQTLEGKLWDQYKPYVTTQFTAPIYNNNQVWIAHAPSLNSYEVLWARNPTLAEDLRGVHDQTADATLSRIDPQTGVPTNFRISLKNVKWLTAIQGTNQVAVVGFAPPFSFKKITSYGKEIEAAVGTPTLLRIDSDGKILQTLQLGPEQAFLEYSGLFSEDGLEFTDLNSYKAIYRNGQFELQSLQHPKITIQVPLTYEEWDRGGTPLQLESDRIAVSGILSLYGGSNRDYTLVNLQNQKAISWRLPSSEDPDNPRSQPCYNAANRSVLQGGNVKRDEQGNSFFSTKTCAVERGPALILPTINGLKVFIGYGDEMFQYLIPNEMLSNLQFESLKSAPSTISSDRFQLSDSRNMFPNNGEEPKKPLIRYKSFSMVKQ